jgi:hypothetical protein
MIWLKIPSHMHEILLFGSLTSLLFGSLTSSVLTCSVPLLAYGNCERLSSL